MLTSLVWLVQFFNNLCFVVCLNPDWNGSNHQPYMGIHDLWAFTIYGHSPFMGILHLWAFTICGHSSFMGILHLWAFTIYGHSPFMGIHHLWAFTIYGYHSCVFIQCSISLVAPLTIPNVLKNVCLCLLCDVHTAGHHVFVWILSKVSCFVLIFLLGSTASNVTSAKDTILIPSLQDT